MAGFYVQDPDEYVYVAKASVPDARRWLTPDEAQAVVFDTKAEAAAWMERLDPYLGPLCVVARRPAQAPSG